MSERVVWALAGDTPEMTAARVARDDATGLVPCMGVFCRDYGYMLIPPAKKQCSHCAMTATVRRWGTSRHGT